MNIQFLKLFESFKSSGLFNIPDVLIDVVAAGNTKILDLNKTHGYMPHPYTYYDQVILNGDTYYPEKTAAAVNLAINNITDMTGPTVAKFISRLPIIYSFGVPTMQTNGRCIIISPKFVQTLLDKFDSTTEGISYVVLHEVFHNVCDHITDGMKLSATYPDHDLQNIAMDMEINYLIEHSTKKFNPDTGKYEYVFEGITDYIGGCYDEKFKGKVWTEIYPELNPDDYKKQPIDDPTVPPEDGTKIVFSDDAKQGFEDAYNKVMEDARKKGLIK